MMVSARGGMHRVYWDLRYQPLGEGGGRGGASVPHRTYPAATAPWAPPGSYVVRLNVGGKSYTQPLTLHLDPRVKTPALALTTLASLTREMYNSAKATRAAADEARALAVQLQQMQGDDVAAFRQQLIAIAPPPPAGGGRGGPGGGRGAGGGRGGRGGAEAAPTLDSASAALLAAAMAMQAADVGPTAREVAACADARRQAAAVMARWTKLRTVDLRAITAKRKAAGAGR
jgi:hypothetical protein